MSRKLDDSDVKILNIMQRNNRLPLDEIAKEVHLSASAVQRRVTRLRKEGIIQSEVAILSPEEVGRKLMAIVEVTLHEEHHTTLEHFNQLMVSTPEVMQCYYVTGEADFVVVITAENMKEFDSLTRTLFSDNPQIKRFRTGVVVRTVKAGLMVPLKMHGSPSGAKPRGSQCEEWVTEV